MLNLDTEITIINRVGLATANKLKKLGVEKVQDLLFYFPFRYDDFSKITAIDKIQPGLSVNVVGQVELIQNKRSHRRRMYITEALINDGTETLKVIWFNQPFIAKNIKVGDRISLAGRIEGDFKEAVMVSPIYEKITGGQAVHTQGLVPNYHLTANLTQKQLRFLIKQVMDLRSQIVDWLPRAVKGELKLIDLPLAINKIHFPKNNNDINLARRRLAFNELFLVQLQSLFVNRFLENSQAASIIFQEKATKKFVQDLPFKLTNSQRRAAWEILQDLAKDKPMSRMLEGDVGSGKTLVAVIALLNVALNNKQSALMVPTEILARQHFDSIGKLLNDFKIKVGLITRSNKQVNNESGIKDNEGKNKDKKHNTSYIIHNTDIIIGTHALIQENIKFKNLALVIIDEQHRFGVEQRKALAEKSGLNNRSPHFLSMTATPIPRSLALALYGDLQLSIINEMPKGRKKIITKIVKEENRSRAYQFINSQIEQGRQVFVICPLIDFSDKLGVKSVNDEYEKLAKEIFPNLKIGKLHGKMKASEKEKIMSNFLDNKIKILISTSVVEVGVDVANATVMMIEGADRFGLAQIHQFRGRVGRSVWQSYCFLFTDSQAELTLKRLETLVKINDGFELARADLKFRGPGEIYGTEQKGFPELKIASLFDYQLMKEAREQAVKLIDQNNNLESFPLLKNKLGEWQKIARLE